MRLGMFTYDSCMHVGPMLELIVLIIITIRQFCDIYMIAFLVLCD